MREYEELTDALRSFVLEQPMFCVATAPLSADGHVNVSPKGLAGFFVFVPKAVYEGACGRTVGTASKCVVAYVDVGGSGIETCAHLQENGRITFVFMHFSGAPKILRLFGEGRYLVPNDGKPYDELLRCFDEQQLLKIYGDNASLSKIRGIVVADIDRIRDSCGYAVPEMAFVAHRDIFRARFASETAEQLLERRKVNNVQSIDGLRGSRTYIDATYDVSHADDGASQSLIGTLFSTPSSTSTPAVTATPSRLTRAVDARVSSLRKARVTEDDKELIALLENDDLEEVIEHEVKSRRGSKLLLDANDGLYTLPTPTLNNASIALASLLAGVTLGYWLKR